MTPHSTDRKIHQFLNDNVALHPCLTESLLDNKPITILIDGHSGVGASKLTQDVTNIIAQMPETLEALTGIDLLSKIRDLQGLKDETPDNNEHHNDEEQVIVDAAVVEVEKEEEAE